MTHPISPEDGRADRRTVQRNFQERWMELCNNLEGTGRNLREFDLNDLKLLTKVRNEVIFQLYDA